MCQYSYSYYFCGCETFVWYDTIEFCENKSVSPWSISGWTADMCKDKVVTCLGYSRYYCNECSEDHTLEYELDE